MIHVGDLVSDSPVGAGKVTDITAGALLGALLALALGDQRVLVVDLDPQGNASTALGPFIRIFDHGFTMDDVRSAVVELEIVAED